MASIAIIDSSDFGANTECVRLYQQTLQHMRQDVTALQQHRKAARQLYVALRDVARAEMAYGDSLKAFDTQGTEMCAKDAVRRLTESGAVHVNISQHFEEMAAYVLDSESELKSLIANERELQCSERSFRQGNAALQKELRSAQQAAKKGAKGTGKASLQLQQFLKHTAAVTKKISNFHKSELEKLLLEERRRMCVLVQHERRLLGWWGPNENAATVCGEIRPLLQNIDDVLRTQNTLPAQALPLVSREEIQRTYFTIQSGVEIQGRDNSPIKLIDDSKAVFTIPISKPLANESQQEGPIRTNSMPMATFSQSANQTCYNTLPQPLSTNQHQESVSLSDLRQASISDSQLNDQPLDEGQAQSIYQNLDDIPTLSSEASLSYMPLANENSHSLLQSANEQTEAMANEGAAEDGLSLPEKAIGPPANKLPRVLIGAYQFLACAEDEISFNPGDRLNVIGPSESAGWVEVEREGRQGVVPMNHCYPEEWHTAPPPLSEM